MELFGDNVHPPPNPNPSASGASGGGGGNSPDNTHLDFLHHLPTTTAINQRVSPTTSESGNDVGMQSHSHRQQQQQSSKSTPINPTSDNTEDEAKRLARMQRNRENAFLSRQRKKQQMMQLQQACGQLKGQNTQLSCLLQRLAAENCLLRHHLGAVCKQSGVDVPDIPSVMSSTLAPLTTNAGSSSANAAQQQQQQQQKTTAAPLSQPPPQTTSGATTTTTKNTTTATTTTTPDGRPVRAKRARITGAGAAFLTLFSIFMFVSTPLGAVHPNRRHSAAPVGLLPAASSSSSSYETVVGPLHGIGGGGGVVTHRHSRALLSIPEEQGPTTTRSVSSNNRNNRKLPIPASLVNQTIDILLQDPRAHTVPEKALQRLQDLAPAAVLLEPETEAQAQLRPLGAKETNPNSDVASKFNPLAASTAFPTLAEQFFKSSGLDAPQTCQKVFEFDAATLPHPDRSRRSVERFITGAYGFKGRSLGNVLGLPSSGNSGGEDSQGTDKALVLSSLYPTGSATAAGEEGGQGGEKESEKEEGPPQGGNTNSGKDELPMAVSEPTLVSILLPANASKPSSSAPGEEEEGVLTAIDRVFVVLLHPGDRFMTYSCGLSRPLLV